MKSGQILGTAKKRNSGQLKGDGGSIYYEKWRFEGRRRKHKHAISHIGLNSPFYIISLTDACGWYIGFKRNEREIKNLIVIQWENRSSFHQKKKGRKRVVFILSQFST